MTRPGEAELIEAAAGELAGLFARRRTGGSVYMDGSHNPMPSEVLAAREFVHSFARAVAEDIAEHLEQERGGFFGDRKVNGWASAADEIRRTYMEDQ